MGRRRRTDERDGEFGWCACVLVCERSSNLKGERWDGTRREIKKLKMGWRRGDGAARFRFSKKIETVWTGSAWRWREFWVCVLELAVAL
jgi:hypothetical protein